MSDDAVLKQIAEISGSEISAKVILSAEEEIDSLIEDENGEDVLEESDTTIDRESFDSNFAKMSELVKKLSPFILQMKNPDAVLILKALKDQLSELQKAKNNARVEHEEADYDRMEGVYAAKKKIADYAQQFQSLAPQLQTWLESGGVYEPDWDEMAADDRKKLIIDFNKTPELIETIVEGSIKKEAPFKSQDQRAFMYSQHPDIAKRWEKETPKGKLPKKVGDWKPDLPQSEPQRSITEDYVIGDKVMFTDSIDDNSSVYVGEVTYVHDSGELNVEVPFPMLPLAEVVDSEEEPKPIEYKRDMITIHPSQVMRRVAMRRQANDPIKDYLKTGSLIIAIEWKAGETRKYSDGFEQIMMVDYGYVVNTTSPDGEEIDVYLGTSFPCKTVYKVEQLDDDGEFDENKYMVGFQDEKDATGCYFAHMPFERFGSLHELTWEEFEAMAHHSDESAGIQITPKKKVAMDYDGADEYFRKLRQYDKNGKKLRHNSIIRVDGYPGQYTMENADMVTVFFYDDTHSDMQEVHTSLVERVKY